MVRAAETYRAARRNAARGTVWQGIEPTGRAHYIARPNMRDRTDDAEVRRRAQSERHAAKFAAAAERLFSFVPILIATAFRRSQHRG